MESLFIQLNLNFKKIDPYDWFCGPGSHFTENNFWIMMSFWNSFMETVQWLKNIQIQESIYIA